MGFKMKGFSPFKQYDPVKKPVGPVTPATQAEYMEREVHNLTAKYKAKEKPRSDSSKKNLIKSLEKAAREVRSQIDKLNNARGDSDEPRSSKYLDLTEEYKELQRELHNRRGE